MDMDPVFSFEALQFDKSRSIEKEQVNLIAGIREHHNRIGRLEMDRPFSLKDSHSLIALAFHVCSSGPRDAQNVPRRFVRLQIKLWKSAEPNQCET